MARITWRNVTAPDLSTSRAALQQAGNSLTSGFQGFADSFRDIEQQQKDAYSQEALARLAQVSDPNQLNAMMASDGLAGLGVTDSRYLNADAMQSILSRPKALFDNQNTAANTAKTEFDRYAAEQKLPGDIALTNAQAASVNQQTKNLAQTFEINKEQRELKLKELETNIAQVQKQTEIAGNQDTREADAAKQELERLNREKKQLENAGAFTAGLMGLNTEEAIEDYFKTAQQNLKSDKTFYDEEIQEVLRKGAKAYFKPILKEQVAEADLAAKTNAERQMRLYYNDPRRLGWNKNAFKEFAQRFFREGSDELKYALDFIDAQPERGINPDFAAEIANDPILAAAATSLEQQRIQLQGKKLRNPLYNAVNIIEGKDSAYKGSYAELMSQLSDEENKLWDINNAKVAAYVQDVASKNTDIPKDLIALVVMDGGGLDPRNLFQRTIPYLGDFTLNEKQIETEARKLMDIFKENNPDQLQSVLKLRAEEDLLNSQTDRFNRRLEAAGREATGTSGYSEEARNRIVAQTILDAEAILGRRLRPEEEADIVESATANPSTTPGSNNWDQAKFDALLEAKLKENAEQQNKPVRPGNLANR